MTTTTTIGNATGTAPDLAHPALAGYLATIPPDADLARLGDELTGAWAAAAAERERGAGLQRRRSAIAAALGTATTVGDAGQSAQPPAT